LQNRRSCNNGCQRTNCPAKDLREKANFKPNDKIAVVACEKDGVVCCIMIIKAEQLADAVSKTLGLLIKGAIEQ